MAVSEGARRSPLKLASQVAAVVLVIGLFALLIWKLAHQQARSEIPQQIQQGKQPIAPLFTLKRLGRPGKVSLASFRGKAVVLNFWASWCAPCRDEAPMFERAWQRYRDKGVVILGIDEGYQDLASDALAFARRHHMTYPLLSDTKNTVVPDYGLTGVPETFFIDRRGRLVGTHIAGPVNEEQLAAGIDAARTS